MTSPIRRGLKHLPRRSTITSARCYGRFPDKKGTETCKGGALEAYRVATIASPIRRGECRHGAPYSKVLRLLSLTAQR